jgi:tetratricopeptide (TPR) repeat protein
LALNPNNQWNLGDMGAMLYYLGKAEEAVHYFKRARAADPYFGPDWYWSDLGQSLMVLSRYDEALTALERVSVPTYRVSAFRAGCCARLGKNDLATIYARDVYRQRTDFDLAKFIDKEPYQFEHDKAQLRESLAMAGLS